MPKIAGTIERSRENSNSRGPRASDDRCLLDVLADGMDIDIDSASGEMVSVDSEEGAVRRAVGRLRGCEIGK